MKPNFDVALEHALESGIEFGIRRIFKHREVPHIDEEGLISISYILQDSVKDQLYTYFDFDEEIEKK